MRPDAPAPAAWRELADWQQGMPADEDGGPWWQVYSDPVLSGLERQIDVSNQTLKAAAYRVSTALLDANRAAYWPTISVNGNDSRT